VEISLALPMAGAPPPPVHRLDSTTGPRQKRALRDGVAGAAYLGDMIPATRLGTEDGAGDQSCARSEAEVSLEPLDTRWLTGHSATRIIGQPVCRCRPSLAPRRGHLLPECRAWHRVALSCERGPVKALVIYDSTFGNTEEIARAIAETLEEKGSARVIRVDEATAPEVAAADVLVIGGPTQRQRPSPAMKAFLESVPRRSWRGLSAAAFDTRYRKSRLLTGSASRRIARSLRKAGASLVVPPESFFVAAREGPLDEGEAQRARDWARQILETFEARTG
jgi:flavodoxin I